MKFMERMKRKKLGNKGFSLVELIIVIAIMAVLLGIVGTQVVPYLNRAREAKDLQIINSFSTAAVSVYSLNADKFVTEDGTEVTEVTIDNVFDRSYAGSPSGTLGIRTKLATDIKELTGYDSATDLRPDMSSTTGKKITKIEIKIDLAGGTITATPYAGNAAILEPVESKIGKKK